jgi:hydrogenase/urease accessory protein HupE
VALVVGLGLVGPATARAHENTRAYGQLELGERQAQLILFARYEDWDQAVGAGRLDADGDGRLTNTELASHAATVNRWLADAVAGRADGRPCPARIATPTVALRGRDLYLRSLLVFDCDRAIGAFTLRYDLFTRLHPGHRLIASVRAGGRETTHIFATDPGRPAEHTLGGTAPAGPLASLIEFVGLGVKHILVGYDHLLFLLALMLGSASRRQLLVTVTAFTAAHSLTLAAAILDLVRLPAAVVEPAIALSVVLVAAHNLLADRHQGGRLPVARVLATFALGLLHGFGFAGVLLELELELGRASLAATLVGFNLGVELGQLALVLLSYPVLTWLRRQPFRLPATRAVSIAILAAGVVWFGGRLPQ